MMHRKRNVVLFMLMYQWAMPWKLEGQVTRIGSELACPKCTITNDHVVTLSGAYFEGPADLIARDAEGRTYMVDSGDRMLKIYGPRGNLLTQVGKKGAGPGEYEVIRNVMVAKNGNIHILDAKHARWTIFSPSGSLLKETPLNAGGGFGLSALLQDDGTMVVNTIAASSARAGFALQRFNDDGQSIGALEDGAFDSRKRWLQRRVMTRLPNGDLLVARPYSFVLNIYSPSLQLKRTVVRQASWTPRFDPDETPSEGVYDIPYTPQLLGASVDSAGLLWLFMALPNPKWKPGPSHRPGTPIDQEQFEKLGSRPRVQTCIEVVDLKKNRVIARTVSDGFLGLPFGNGYVVKSLEDAAGEPSLNISHLSLKR